jgi:hypothetical protein
VPILTAPGAEQHSGGVFRMVTDSGEATITHIAIKENGTVAAQYLSNFHLHYDYDTTAPYDCVSETYSEGDPLFGNSAVFINEKSDFYAQAVISSTKAICLYPVLGIKSGPTAAQTLELEIENPSTQISILNAAGVTPSTAVLINGTTIINPLPPVSLRIEAFDEHVQSITIPENKRYLGGTFKIYPDNGPATLTKVSVTEKGSVDEKTNLSGTSLYYDLDTTAPYDCRSESYSGNEDVFGNPTAFVSSKASFTGSLVVDMNKVACFYVVTNIGSGASDQQTIAMEISNPNTDITVLGATVVSTGTVKPSGTIVLSKPLLYGVTVTSIGTQNAVIAIPSSSSYVGGAFRMVANSGNTNINRLAITETGTVASERLSGVTLRYDIDSIAPYDCESEKYDPTDPMFGNKTNLTSNRAVFTGDIPISTTRTACLYVILDVRTGAKNGETLEIEIPSPSTEIIAFGGATVFPQSSVTLQGTSVLSTTPNTILPIDKTVYDGDLIRAVNDYKVYIVKFVGNKKFIRHIIDSQIFGFYGHLGFATVKEVPNLEGYTLSAWVRMLVNPVDKETEKVYEINDDAGPGGSKHWITCQNAATSCETAWRNHGGDPDGIYTVNEHEMKYYILGGNVPLD